MAEVNRGHFEILPMDILPNIHLGPVAEGKDPHVFARINTGIVKIPNLGTLVFGVPLAEAIAETEEPLFGASFLFVPPRTPDATIEPELFDGGQQCGNLQAVAADFAGGRNGDAFGHSFLDLADNEFGAKLGRATIAKLIQFGKMMTGIDVQKRHRDFGWAKCLLR